MTAIRVGDSVRVPWGISAFVPGEVVEVWGDPPTQVRVRLRFPSDDDGLDYVEELLLSPAILQPAA